MPIFCRAFGLVPALGGDDLRLDLTLKWQIGARSPCNLHRRLCRGAVALFCDWGLYGWCGKQGSAQGVFHWGNA